MSQYRDNEAQGRFEWEEDDAVSFADYAIGASGVRAILHVETPPEARGKGAAARLMDAIVADARARGFKILPRCSYAVAHVRRHKEIHDVLA